TLQPADSQAEGAFSLYQKTLTAGGACPSRHGYSVAAIPFMRSSADCKMIVAATLSMTSPRRFRLLSASINMRSAAIVDQRSSHSKIGSGDTWLKLRAKARVACARGP